MIKKIPHTFALIFYIIIFAAILTWLIPGGEFDKETININNSKRTVIVADSYHKVESKPQTWEIFSAFFKGFVDKSEIIIFIFMVGGAFMIVGKSRAIDAGIFTFLNMTSKQMLVFFKWCDGKETTLLQILVCGSARAI